jgi:hypothetical protein
MCIQSIAKEPHKNSVRRFQFKSREIHFVGAVRISTPRVIISCQSDHGPQNVMNHWSSRNNKIPLKSKIYVTALDKPLTLNIQSSSSFDIPILSLSAESTT